MGTELLRTLPTWHHLTDSSCSTPALATTALDSTKGVLDIKATVGWRLAAVFVQAGSAKICAAKRTRRVQPASLCCLPYGTSPLVGRVSFISIAASHPRWKVDVKIVLAL